MDMQLIPNYSDTLTCMFKYVHMSVSVSSLFSCVPFQSLPATGRKRLSSLVPTNQQRAKAAALGRRSLADPFPGGRARGFGAVGFVWFRCDNRNTATVK